MAAEQIVRFRMNVNDENAAQKKLLHEPNSLENCPIELEMTCFHCTVCGTYTEFSEIPPEIALTCENVLEWHRRNTTNFLCKKPFVFRQMTLVFHSCECGLLNGIKIPVSSKPYEKIDSPPVKCECGTGYSAYLQKTPNDNVEVAVFAHSKDGTKIDCVNTKKIITQGGQNIPRDSFWISPCPGCDPEASRKNGRGYSKTLTYFVGEARCVHCDKKYIMAHNREKELFEIKSVPR